MSILVVLIKIYRNIFAKNENINWFKIIRGKKWMYQ